jgi:hypothetical protein
MEKEDTMAADENMRRGILAVFLYGAMAMYLIGLIWIGVMSAAGDVKDIPEYLITVVVTLGGTLATVFGGYLGIAIKDIRTLGEQDGQSMLGFDTTPFTLKNARTIAVIVYAVSLFGALIFWAATNFSPDVAEAIKDLAMTLLGVFVGVLSLLGDPG